MRPIIFISIVTLTPGSAGLAADTYDVKVYPCARADGPIVVDGNLSESPWRQATLAGGFTYYNRPELVATQTFFRVLYDAKHLYMGIQCDEPTMDRLIPVQHARDSHSVFHGETIEIFIDPRHDHTRYYQIAVSAAGSVYDSAKTDPLWSADVAAKTKLDKKGWTLELSIPWSDLGVSPKPGVVIGFNICRDRYLGHGREWSNWSQTNANFHDPQRFAHLVLSANPGQLGRLGAELRKGSRRGPIVIYSPTGVAQTTYRAMARESVATLESLLAKLAEVLQREADAGVESELKRRIRAYEKELGSFQRKIASTQPFDAATWTRMEHRITVLSAELGQVIWDARLAALLSNI